MGTTWSLKLRHAVPRPQAAWLGQHIQDCLDSLCQQMSHWQKTSLISRINAAQPGWYKLPNDMFTVLSAGLTLARETGGAYDPTLGALSDLWGFGPEKVPARALPPSQTACVKALNVCGYGRTALHPERKAVWQPGGVRFDLSSIAKGYALDKVSQMLRAMKLEHFLLEIGGELKAAGKREHNRPWQVEIELPGAPGTSGVIIALHDQAIATSGNYRRVIPGTPYWHTLSPFTGRPVEHGLKAVTVLHPQCMMADALATALLVLGPGKAQHYAIENRLAALFMFENGTIGSVNWTPRFLQLTKSSHNQAPNAGRAKKNHLAAAAK